MGHQWVCYNLHKTRLNLTNYSVTLKRILSLPLYFRHRLMEIENHILSLTMEFERQNIIITEWEAEKAKKAGDRKWYRKQERKHINNKQGGLPKKGREKRKKRKDPQNKPMSAVSNKSDSSKSKEENDQLSKRLPKIVIQPSLSDNDEDNEGNGTLGYFPL